MSDKRYFVDLDYEGYCYIIDMNDIHKIYMVVGDYFIRKCVDFLILTENDFIPIQEREGFYKFKSEKRHIFSYIGSFIYSEFIRHYNLNENYYDNSDNFCREIILTEEQKNNLIYFSQFQYRMEENYLKKDVELWEFNYESFKMEKYSLNESDYYGEICYQESDSLKGFNSFDIIVSCIDKTDVDVDEVTDHFKDFEKEAIKFGGEIGIYAWSTKEKTYNRSGYKSYCFYKDEFYEREFKIDEVTNGRTFSNRFKVVPYDKMDFVKEQYMKYKMRERRNKLELI